MEHREALYVLNMLPQVGPVRKRILELMFGSVEAAFQAGEEKLSRVSGIGEKLARVICHWEDYCNLGEELRMCREAGVSMVVEEDDAYPPLLREIHDPPICLYVCGDLEALKKTDMAVGMVGSRNATMYGRRMAERLASAASMAGWPVVSGLARGIDTASHEATLLAGGRTIAVIGSGLTKVYPQENLGLANRIVQSGGAVVTEFQMQYQPDRRSFPMRNRIISGMSRGTIVVEAGLHSGSLITAAMALEQGRTVFAVPGMADSPTSQGCNGLIKDGAVLTETFQDVIDDFTGLPGLKKPPKESQARPQERVDVAQVELSQLEEKLYGLIKGGVSWIDDLIEQSGESASCVLAGVMTLELKRLIRQLPGKRVEIR